MTLEGRWTGKLIIAFEDESGLALVDMLLGRPMGTSTNWGELEESAALETGNILACAYLNSLTAHLPARHEMGSELLPSPPVLITDFAGSLLEAAFMEQAMVSDQVLLVRTQFCRDETQLRWHLFLIPDPEALVEIKDSLEIRG
jgi:chemotaxis protein CheC